MGGVGITFNDSDAQRLLGGILGRLKNKAPAMKILGSIAQTSVVRNFEVGGRPTKWTGHSPATEKIRGKGKPILRKQGMAGGLMGSVNYRPFNNNVVVHAGSGKSKDYAAIHHFGGMAGRGRKVKIPARPYMMIQDEDMKEMKAALNEFIILGKT